MYEARIEANGISGINSWPRQDFIEGEKVRTLADYLRKRCSPKGMYRHS